MATPAPACKAALAEATRLWPNRNRASDGIMSSDAHKKQNPNSGHDLGNAFDLTDDPDNGCDAHALAARCMGARDERVLYVISRARIWSAARYWEGWRPYTGRNSHTTHAHFELDPAHRDSTWPWWPPAAPPAPVPKPQPNTIDLEPQDGDIFMAIYKDQGDLEVLWVRRAYLDLLGREPEGYEVVLMWIEILRAKGADAVYSGIADSAEGQARRAAVDRLLAAS